jgi:predicted dienelactone hydrolase
VYPVAQQTFTLVDRSRPTPANGTYPGAPSRTLVTVVSLPVGATGPLPLVVFSTGIGGTATNYQGLYRHWVEAGYAVAAPNFPLSRAGAPGGTTANDIGSQPGDVRFVLRRLLAMSGSRRGPLAGRLDPGRVALVGKSLGAITTLTAAYRVQDHERRERAVISLTGAAPATGFFTGIDVPLLLVHGDADRTVPYGQSAAIYQHAEPPKYLVTLFGQDHGGAFNGEDIPAGRVVVRVTLDFLDAYVREDPNAPGRLVRHGTVPRIAALQATPS